MKTGFNLLNGRSSMSDELKEFLTLNFVPYSFKTFVRCFNLSYSMVNFSKVLINEKLEFFVKSSIFKNYVINNEEYNATIDQIFDLPELLLEYANYQERTDHWHNLGLMKIGLLFHGDVLLIGLSNDKYGEIWRYGSGLLNTQHCKLDDNIFEFVSRLREEIDFDQLDYLGFSEKDLFKNWGEDFWRIRE